MPKTLTDKAVAKLKPKSKTYHHPDPELRGHYVRIQPSGTGLSARGAENVRFTAAAVTKPSWDATSWRRSGPARRRASHSTRPGHLHHIHRIPFGG